MQKFSSKSSFLHKNKKKYLSKIYNNYYINIIKYHNMREINVTEFNLQAARRKSESRNTRIKVGFIAYALCVAR